jgi:site-specific recombinase XerD
MTTTIAPFEDIASWERALYAFLAEKERRSGSRRTVEGYSRMLQHFFGTLGKPPDQVTSQEVFTFAHGVGLSGKEPSAVTIGARMACISSFYRFLIRMDIVASNPCDQLERPKVSSSPPRGLSAEEIRRLLAVIPEKPVSLRDRAIILTLTLTGRRRSEVMNMKVGDISVAGGLFYTYRGKGGKQAKRELPRPAFEAIEIALAAWGKSLATMTGEERRDLVRLVLVKVEIGLRTGGVEGLTPKAAFAPLLRVLAEEEGGLISVCAWRPRGVSGCPGANEARYMIRSA